MGPPGKGENRQEGEKCRFFWDGLQRNGSPWLLNGEFQIGVLEGWIPELRVTCCRLDNWSNGILRNRLDVVRF